MQLGSPSYLDFGTSARAFFLRTPSDCQTAKCVSEKGLESPLLRRPSLSDEPLSPIKLISAGPYNYSAITAN